MVQLGLDAFGHQRHSAGFDRLDLGFVEHKAVGMLILQNQVFRRFLDDDSVVGRSFVQLDSHAIVVVVDRTIWIQDRNKQLRRSLGARVGYIWTDSYAQSVYSVAGRAMLDEMLLASLEVHLKAQAVGVAIDDLLPVGLDSA